MVIKSCIFNMLICVHENVQAAGFYFFPLPEDVGCNSTTILNKSRISIPRPETIKFAREAAVNSIQQITAFLKDDTLLINPTNIDHIGLSSEVAKLKKNIWITKHVIELTSVYDTSKYQDVQNKLVTLKTLLGPELGDLDSFDYPHYMYNDQLETFDKNMLNFKKTLYNLKSNISISQNNFFLKKYFDWLLQFVFYTDLAVANELSEKLTKVETAVRTRTHLMGPLIREHLHFENKYNILRNSIYNECTGLLKQHVPSCAQKYYPFWGELFFENDRILNFLIWCDKHRDVTGDQMLEAWTYTREYSYPQHTVVRIIRNTPRSLI